MRVKTFHLLMAALVFSCVIGLCTGNASWAQVTETPTETPVETPTVAPTATNTIIPTATATNTPVPPTPTAAETPTVAPIATNTPVETPTATPTVAAVAGLSVTGGSVNAGEEIAVGIEVTNAANIDAFGFDILQSNNILTLVSVETTGTLTNDFLFVDASALASPVGAVRVGGVGGDASANGNGTLLRVRYRATGSGTTTLTLANLEDDLSGATLTGGTVSITESPTATPTVGGETGTATPTPAPPTPTATAVPPTATVTAVPPTPTPTTESPTATPVVPPTSTPGPVTPSPTTRPGQTPLPVFTPTPSPTALLVNPVLGLVGQDILGGAHPSGNAVHNFDIGISSPNGDLLAPGVFDGFPDPSAYGPFLFLFFMDGSPNGTFVPIARDIEFTGEIQPLAQGGNGSEGAYFLIGGNVGPYPPVNPRLGATGGANRGGIDVDNNPANNLNLGTYSGDIVPVFFEDSTTPGQPGRFVSTLVDVEPAGNSGFYVLDIDGRIYAEGTGAAALDTTVQISPGSQAVALKIFRGRAISAMNSQYSTELVGTGAYVLDSLGKISPVGAAPAVNAAAVPVVNNATVFTYHDIELIPNETGTEFIGVGVLNGDGMVAFAPFTDVTLTPAIETYVKNLTPFGNARRGFPFDIARDYEVEISDSPIYGLGPNGQTTTVTTRRTGTFMFDGFGGTHTGGQSTRFAPAFGFGTRTINGQNFEPFPVSVPYFGVDVLVDVEVAPPVQR